MEPYDTCDQLFKFQARLAMRQRLPGDEACLDLAHVMLIEEVDN